MVSRWLICSHLTRMKTLQPMLQMWGDRWGIGRGFRVRDILRKVINSAHFRCRSSIPHPILLLGAGVGGRPFNVSGCTQQVRRSWPSWFWTRGMERNAAFCSIALLRRQPGESGKLALDRRRLTRVNLAVVNCTSHSKEWGVIAPDVYFTDPSDWQGSSSLPRSFWVCQALGGALAGSRSGMTGNPG